MSVWTGSNSVCAHSKKDDQQPWWAVDLQNVYYVNVINIYGRTDGMYYFFIYYFNYRIKVKEIEYYSFEN